MSILLLPASYNLTLNLFYNAMMLIPCLLTPFIIYRATAKIDNNNMFLLLAAIAAVVSLVWLVLIHEFKIDIVSYPFDLIITLLCFSIYWFKRYFRLLEESQQKTMQLEKVDKQKDEFLTTVAHEIKNPLHGILNISQTVLEREKKVLSENSMKDLEIIITIGRHTSTLLNILLDLERLKEDHTVIQRRYVSLEQITNVVLDMVRYMAEEKSITLHNRIPENFPLVYADKNRLIQILFNLLHNTVKHSQASDVSVQAAIDGYKANISVTDNGVGIEEEFLTTIFNRYKQTTKSSSQANNGFGLGLHICKQLVEFHGSSLEVRSKKNQGTTFTFSLTAAITPAENKERSKTNVVTESGQLETIERPKKQVSVTAQSVPELIRILAVDDDPINLRVLQSLFS